MEEYQIKTKVNSAIEQWVNLQNRRGIHVNITPRAVDFIFELITNIQLDPSKYWRKIDNYNYNSAQEFAISLIPNALNEIIISRDFRYRIFKNSSSITISSWELWRALSEVLTTFCFIPEDDM
ncbi:hypothetical protein [Sabulibacter ruber]|uniref:hypothetical protein n=1 Tax=Sabulibacter ruber TaxID=2811901 RepID=UPI001A970044|nr:hypothetical protein [Sabulibacter ruber]